MDNQLMSDGFIRLCAITDAPAKRIMVMASSRAITPSKIEVNVPDVFNSDTMANTAPGAVAAEMAPRTKDAEMSISIPAFSVSTP